MLSISICGIKINKPVVRSVGILNEKLGLNLYNVSYLLREKNNSELYFSFGTSIMVSGVGIGWKRYYEKINDKILPFVNISLYERLANRMAIVNGSAVRADTCIGFSGGVRFNTFTVFKRNLNFQIGAFSTYDFRNDIQLLPFINLEIRYK